MIQETMALELRERDREWLLDRVMKLEAIVDAARETTGLTLCACKRGKKCPNALMYKLLRALGER